jgi:hypothetical protein
MLNLECTSQVVMHDCCLKLDFLVFIVASPWFRFFYGAKPFINASFGRYTTVNMYRMKSI